MIALLAIAASFWGATPACGPVKVVSGDLSAHPGTAGWADPSTCTIELDPRASVSRRDDCILLTHEYGHLLGLEHDHDNDVMNPAAMYGWGIVPQCEGSLTNVRPRPRLRYRRAHPRARRPHRQSHRIRRR